MALELTIDQKSLIGIESITDRAGNPAKIDGKPVWASSDESLFTLEPAEDGMSAYAVAGDKVGEAGMITMTADADLGEGVRSLIGTLEVHILGGEAQFVQLAASTPEPKA